MAFVLSIYVSFYYMTTWPYFSIKVRMTMWLSNRLYVAPRGVINYRIFGIIGPTSRVIKYGIRVGDNSILGFIGVIPVIGMSQKRSLSEPIRISIVIGSHGSIPIGDRTQRTATNIMLIILSYRPFSIPLSSCLASFVSFRYI